MMHGKGRAIVQVTAHNEREEKKISYVCRIVHIVVSRDMTLGIHTYKSHCSQM